MRLSLPKSWQQVKDWKQLRPMLLELANKIETTINNSNQLYVSESTTSQPEGLKRRDIFMQITELEGADSLKIYWFDGKDLQPLKFNSIGGLIQPEQIDHFDFLHLTDTPDSYSGSEGFTVKVRPDGSGLEFVDTSAGGVGTVTSVDASSDDPLSLSVTGGPITTSGTLIFSLADELKKFVQAADWPLGDTSLLDINGTFLIFGGGDIQAANQGLNHWGNFNFQANIHNDAVDGPLFKFQAIANDPLPNGQLFVINRFDSTETDLWAVDTSGNEINYTGGYDSSNFDAPLDSPATDYVRNYWRDGSYIGRFHDDSEVIIYPQDGSGGGGGINPAREYIIHTTGSLPDGSTEDADVSMGTNGKLGALIQIATDEPARVRMYGTSTDRTSDAARLVGTFPPAGEGVQGEFITDSSQLTIRCGPIPMLANQDTTSANTLYLAITNMKGSTDTIEVTMRFTGLES